jgi:hypothetical protein
MIDQPTPSPEQLAAIAKIQRDERLERLGTILLLLVAGVVLQVLGAPESLVGGALGAAAALVKSNASRGATMLASGVGAILGAVLGGWMPVLA